MVSPAKLIGLEFISQHATIDRAEHRIIIRQRRRGNHHGIKLRHRGLATGVGFEIVKIKFRVDQQRILITERREELLNRFADAPAPQPRAILDRNRRHHVRGLFDNHQQITKHHSLADVVATGDIQIQRPLPFIPEFLRVERFDEQHLGIALGDGLGSGLGGSGWRYSSGLRFVTR